MGNTLIGYGNYADEAIFSGGSWYSTLPIENLKNRQLARVARSASLDPTASQFDFSVSIGKTIRVIGLLNHNISSTGNFRIRGSADPDFNQSSYDSGWLPVWPPVYPLDSLEWENDNFWTGTYNKDELAGYPWHFIYLLDTSQRQPYWRVEISDQGNPDGYVQIGRLFASNVWQPTNGIAFGASIGWEDQSTTQRSASLSKYFNQKPPYRVARFLTHFMETDEAYGRAFEIMRQSGIWKEVLYIHDDEDTIHALRRRFVGCFRGLDALTNPYPDFHDANWEIEEDVP